MIAWTVAILSSREAPASLAMAISAAIHAIGPETAVLDVVVNGNHDLAEAIVARLPELPMSRAPNTTLRIWDLPLGGKAHAWNTYLHQIWPGSELAFFVDGYVAVRPDALALLADGLRDTPQAIAATGVPSMGRTARQMRERLLREGGTHGNLHALRGETMRRFRDAGFRMPLGLYRTDALLNSCMSFNLDPSRHDWDPRRVLVHPEASWSLRPLVWYSPSDLLTHLRRLLRQAQGEAEKRAFANHLAERRLSPASLPASAADMVAQWLAAVPDQARLLLRRRPLLRWATRRLLSSPPDFERAKEPARLVGQVSPGEASPAAPCVQAPSGVSLLRDSLLRPGQPAAT